MAPRRMSAALGQLKAMIRKTIWIATSLTRSPKGSLDLGMQFRFGRSEVKPSSTIEYATLFKFMTDLAKVAPDLGKMLRKPLEVDRIKTVPYRLLLPGTDKEPPSGAKARIVIKAKTGDQVHHAKAGGVVEVPWSKDLLAENPKVVIPNFKVVIANDVLWDRLVKLSAVSP